MNMLPLLGSLSSVEFQCLINFQSDSLYQECHMTFWNPQIQYKFTDFIPMFCYIMKNVTIWSVQDLSGRKHACSPLSYLLMHPLISPELSCLTFYQKLAVTLFLYKCFTPSCPLSFQSCTGYPLTSVAISTFSQTPLHIVHSLSPT